MIRMSVKSLEPGMVIGKAVYDSQGKVLLNSGVALTRPLINALGDRGIAGCLIQDGNTDDIIPNENITEYVRSTTIRKMSAIFNSIQGVNRKFKMQSISAVRDMIHSDNYQDAIGRNPEFKKLTNVVQNIVSELFNSPQVMLGMNALKTYDDYYYQHATEVAVTAIMIGRKIGLPPKRLNELGIGCLMMDVGNIFIPRDVLNKHGKLTPQEFEMVKEHTVIGFEILKNVPSVGVLPPHVAFQHHEKQDGNGYPRGITGNNSTVISDEPKTIHLYASIAAIADVYDSMTSETPYRKAFPREKVISMMSKLGGKHFNKEVLKSFLSITPIYPEGSTVLVTLGKYKNKIGVTTAINKEDLSRPVIRLFMDTKRNRIKPVEINMLEERLVKIETILL